MKGLKGLSHKVLTILKESPNTRDDDWSLIFALWKRYFPQHIAAEGYPQRYWIELQNIRNLPNPAHIIRIRAWFQNTKRLYPPTSIEVAKARGWNELEWREAIIK